MGILIQDSFTDADGTLLKNHESEIGGLWLPTSGSRDGFIYNNAAEKSDNKHSKQSVSFDTYAQAVLSASYNDSGFYLFINDTGSFPETDMLEINVYFNEIYLNGILLAGVSFISGLLYKIIRVGADVFAYKGGVLIGSVASRGLGYSFGISVNSAVDHGANIDNYEAGEEVVAPYVDHLMMMGVH